MSRIRAFGGISVISGLCVLALIPAILLAENLQWREGPLHMMQMLAVVVCFCAGLLDLWFADRPRPLVLVATGLSACWLAFLVYLLATIDFGVLDR